MVTPVDRVAVVGYLGSMRRVSRRRLLAISGSAALLLVAGLGAIRASGYRINDGIARSLKVLSAWQYVVVEAVGLRLLAPERSNVGLFVDEYCVHLRPEDRRDLLRFLGYVEHLSPLSLGYVRRFSSLPVHAQDEVLGALETSSSHDLRAGFQALKALVMMEFYRRPETWTSIGYDGPVRF
jgi:hypothetical protein